MIGRLTGRIVQCTPDSVLLDVGGVGYEIRIPLSTYYVLADTTEPASLHVHTHVREDALQLFGFASTAERGAFTKLIGINGVGPKVALALLSGIGVAELWETVRHKDRDRLQKIPGIGKKTAERVLLELRDRVAQLDVEAGLTGEPPTAGAKTDAGSEARKREDSISALVNLGYTDTRARKAVAAVLEELGGGATIEAILKAALSGLIR